jgi:uncharacterized oxidoreductase
LKTWLKCDESAKPQAYPMAVTFRSLSRRRRLASWALISGLLLDDLIAEGGAAVVNITSVLALAPKRSAPVYSATKAALRAFTLGLRYQLAAHRQVRIVEVLPPVVDTAMTAGRGSDKMDPADVAERIVDGLERDEEEIWVGKARLVRLLARVAPTLVARILRDA